jgi:hypothetical protein
VQGKKAVGALISVQFAAVMNVKVEIFAISSEINENLAFAHSLQKINLSDGPSNLPVATIYRQVDCYHRVRANWLIVYQQLSVPFDPTTDKAVLNAGP